MANYLCLVIGDNLNTIPQLNAKIFQPGQDTMSGATACALFENYLSAMKSGVVSCSLQITTRDTDPSISTSGSSSTQVTYTDLN